MLAGADEACSDLSQEADVADGAAARQGFRMLEAAMERARAAEKPLFISALAIDQHSQGQPGWMTAPAELLACLQGEVTTFAITICKVGTQNQSQHAYLLHNEHAMSC